MRIATLLLILGCGMLAAAQTTSGYRISGPYTHDNLSVFLIHKKDSGQTLTKNYLPLKEAMEQKKVLVNETKQVNELTVENVSDQPVFIQGGDIVKGGQQDRVISNDFVLPPKSGRLPVKAFCVEQGRWTQRGNESPAQFSASNVIAASKSVKIAAGPAADQVGVWNAVKNLQGGLIGTGLASARLASPSSLELTLTSVPVENAVRAYVDALSGIVRDKKDAIGMAFAVNGEVNSSDLYASPALFALMWPKLLKASAVEAVQLKKNGSVAPVASSTIDAFLMAGEGGKAESIAVDKRITLVKRENKQQVLLESREDSSWIHRNYLSK
jgi:hypothetical protein